MQAWLFGRLLVYFFSQCSPSVRALTCALQFDPSPRQTEDKISPSGCLAWCIAGTNGMIFGCRTILAINEQDDWSNDELVLATWLFSVQDLFHTKINRVCYLLFFFFVFVLRYLSVHFWFRFVVFFLSFCLSFLICSFLLLLCCCFFFLSFF